MYWCIKSFVSECLLPVTANFLMLEFYRWTITLFLNFCAVGPCEKKTNFTTTLQRNMLEGKVAVGLRRGGEGSEQWETGVESSTATLPSFGHSAYSPAKACRTLQTKAASQRQRCFLLLHNEDALPLSTSNHEQLALML